MKHPQTYPLPPAIRARCEGFFGTSLAQVRLKVEPLPACLKARALACGNQIWLAPGHDDFSRPANLQLLGHELTHVLQQRQGRVVARKRWSSGSLNADPQLEHEAEAMGHLLMAGLPCPIDFTTQHGPHRPPVGQCSVVVGPMVLKSFDALSRKAQQVLRMTEDAQAWLNWAIRDVVDTYNFMGEPQLAEGVQIGLHGTPLLLLKRSQLLVNPLTLMELDGADVAAISEYELSDDPTALLRDAAQKVFQANKLYSQHDLQQGLHFLNQLGVAASNVFRIMNLPERIALTRLSQWQPDRTPSVPLSREAATYGVTFAQSPLEFVDLYQCFIVLVQRLDPRLNFSTDKRNMLVSNYLDQLKPLLRGQLQAPVCGSPPSPAGLLQFLQTWAALGNSIGFARFTSATNQVIQNTRLGSEHLVPVQDRVTQYLNHARAFVDRKQPVAATLSQEGLSYNYDYPGVEQSASITWQDQTLVLASFHSDALMIPLESSVKESPHNPMNERQIYDDTFSQLDPDDVAAAPAETPLEDPNGPAEPSLAPTSDQAVTAEDLPSDPDLIQIPPEDEPQPKATRPNRKKAGSTEA